MINTAGFRLIFATFVIFADIVLAGGGMINVGWISFVGMIVIWLLAWFDHDADERP